MMTEPLTSLFVDSRELRLQLTITLQKVDHDGTRLECTDNITANRRMKVIHVGGNAGDARIGVDD